MAEIMAEVKELASVEDELVDPSWRAAMQVEYDSIVKNDTWELVE